MKVGVIGAGHAGVAAAHTAAKAGADVVLFSDENVLPYFRPRLVAMAFGQVEKDAMTIHPLQWYRDNGIDFRINAAVAAIDSGAGTVVSRGREQRFESIIIATGAGPFLPRFTQDAPECVLPLWHIVHAEKIRSLANPGTRITIVGGGIIGIEAALRAADRGLTTVIVEKTERLMMEDLDAEASGLVRSHLEERGIKVLTGKSVVAVSRKNAAAVVALDDGKDISADVVLVSVGAFRDLTLAAQAGLDRKTGICVDSALQTSAEKVFACGDISQLDGMPRCSVPGAVSQGKLAGENACALISKGEIREYAEEPVPLSFKYGDLRIHGKEVFCGGQ